MCKVASFKNFENGLTTVKVMTKTKVAPFYLVHGVDCRIEFACFSFHVGLLFYQLFVFQTGHPKITPILTL